MQRDSNEIVNAEFLPLAGWMAISGMNRSAVYAALGRGDLKAVKLGRRILIDVPAGRAWLRSLPRAEIRAPAKKNCEAPQ